MKPSAPVFFCVFIRGLALPSVGLRIFFEAYPTNATFWQRRRTQGIGIMNNFLGKPDSMHRSSQLQTARARYLSRRWFLRDCGVGLASVAASTLLAADSAAATPTTTVANPLAPQPPHFTGKVKRVIYIFQAGAPSHLELFDNKPELAKRNGQLPPAELLKGYRAAFINPNSALLGSKFKFARHGQCGMELSEVLPHTAKVADELCLIQIGRAHV